MVATRWRLLTQGCGELHARHSTGIETISDFAIRVPLKTVLDAIPANVRTDQRRQEEMEVDHLLRTDGQAAEAPHLAERTLY
jgi:hypothetical protein